jgi:F0F1-type ATP synthase beta subunit
MQTFEKLRELVNSMEEDVTKFYEKGNSSAGTRVRVALQGIKKLAQEFRTEIQEAKKKD